MMAGLRQRKLPRYRIEWPAGMEPTPNCVADYLKESCKFYWNNKESLQKELLSGITVAVMQVPESVAFSFVAGVPPLYGLYATFFLGLITAAIGGAPGMISGAAGALAVVARDITYSKGPYGHLPELERIEYLLLAMFFAGIFQILVGMLGLAKLVKLIPESAMLGFVNGLAIVIFMAQLGAFKQCVEVPSPKYFEECSEEYEVYMTLNQGEVWMVLMIVAVTMFIVQFWQKVPKIGKFIPGSLVALIFGTFFEHVINRTLIGWDTRTVEDTASLSGRLPPAHFPDVDWSNSGDIRTAVQYGVSLGAIGLVESVMTLQVVFEITLTPQSTFRANQECIAQGVANLLSSLFRAMGGDAMIGQSTINVINGARGRLSGMTAGVVMLIIIVGLHFVIALVPIAALTGVLFMVVIHTFNWRTFEILYRGSWKDSVVIILVTALAVIFDLAIAVAAGVVVASLFSSWASGKLLHARTVIESDDTGKTVKRYFVSGPLFFGSSRSFLDLFSPATDPDYVAINFSDSRICDFTAVAAIRSIAIQYKHVDKTVELEDVSEKCLHRLDRTKKYVTDHIDLDELKNDVTAGDPQTGHMAIIPRTTEEEFAEVDDSSSSDSGRDDILHPAATGASAASTGGGSDINIELGLQPTGRSSSRHSKRSTSIASDTSRSVQSTSDSPPQIDDRVQHQHQHQPQQTDFHQLPMFEPVSTHIIGGPDDGELRDLRPQDEQEI